jgi:hypothetical protein
MQGGREKQQCAYWHEADAEPGIVLEVPEAAEGHAASDIQPWRINAKVSDGVERI